MGGTEATGTHKPGIAFSAKELINMKISKERKNEYVLLPVPGNG